MSNKYTLGIDIGSTTVKIAILDENDTLLFADYQRHFANIRLGRNLLKRSGYRNYLLYKRNAKVVGEGKSAGACDYRMKGKFSKFAKAFARSSASVSWMLAK